MNRAVVGEDADEMHPFFDMIDGRAGQFQPVDPTYIPAQREAAAIAHQNADFVNSLFPEGHRPK